MQKPVSLTSSTRASDPAPSTRPGQAPLGERALARLCFFSLPTAGAEDWRRLSTLGLGTAIAVEASERTALGLAEVTELARAAGTLGLAQGFVVGASCEPLLGASTILEQLDALARQAAAIEEAGGVPLLLPLAALARRRAREDEYVEVYRALLARSGGPLLVDWTGPHTRPELQGYFPGRSFERVMALDPAKVRGARLDLADVTRETLLRRELARRDQLVFSADREHLGRLLLGLNPGPASARIPAVERYTEFAGLRVALGDFSHAMLSGTWPEAEALAAGLARLEAGDAAAALAAFEPAG
jgi:hypothetical protein